MTAIITYAHVSLWKAIFSLSNKNLINIYRNKSNRKKELLESIWVFLNYRHYFRNVILLECVMKKTPRYLQAIPDCQFACSFNRLKTMNKGILEFENISNYLLKDSVPDNEIILKLTGRYLIKKGDFINFACNSTSSFVVRKDSDVWGERGRGVHTFLFAAQAIVLKEFNNWLIDGNRYLAYGMTPVEWIFAEYLDQSSYGGIYYPHSLNVLARYSSPLTPMDV